MSIEFELAMQCYLGGRSYSRYAVFATRLLSGSAAGRLRRPKSQHASRFSFFEYESAAKARRTASGCLF